MIPVQTGTQCAGRGSEVRDGVKLQATRLEWVPPVAAIPIKQLPAVTYSAGKGGDATPLVHLAYSNLPFTACGEHLVAHVSTTGFRDAGVTCPGCRAHIEQWPASHYTQADGLIAGPGRAVCGAGPLETATGYRHLVDCPDCIRWIEERGGARG